MLVTQLIYFVYSTVVQTCEENICENGGSCTRHVNDYTCMCSPGFSGFLCEEGMPFTRVCKPQKLNHSLGTCIYGVTKLVHYSLLHLNVDSFR